MRMIHMIDILSIGGAQKLLALFMREAENYKINAEVICLNPESISPVGKEIQALGVKVTYFPARHLFDVERLVKIYCYIKQNNPDLIQTHLLYANIIGGIAGYLAGIPVIATLHSTGSLNWRSEKRNLFEAKVIKYLDRAVIAVGYKTAEVYKDRLRNKNINVIPNAIGIPDEHNDAERLLIRNKIFDSDDEKILISVGRLAPQKSYSDLIKAFFFINNRLPQTKLVLVGDGEQRSVLEQIVFDYKLVGKVVFLGFRDDINLLLSASDLYVNSSIVEGMPLSIMEAMMIGLPTVVTSVGDLPYMINPKCGILVPPKNPEELAQAVIDLLENAEKLHSIGNNAKTYALDNFSSSRWMEKLLDLYKQIRN